jgi:hypothetical protein
MPIPPYDPSVADVLPYRHKGTGKVQDLTADQVALFPGQFDRLGEEPKNDLGEDEGSTPNSHDDSGANAAPSTTGD